MVGGLVPVVAWLVSLPYNYSISDSPFYDGEWSYLPLTLAIFPLWPLTPYYLGFYRSSPTLCNVLVAAAAALLYFAAGIIIELLFACAKRAVLSLFRAVRR